MSKQILLLSLETFGATGGIQRMGRTLAHTLHKLSLKHKWTVRLYALCDRTQDLMPAYLPATSFRAFNRKRFRFVFSSIRAALKADVVILSHINLSIIGCLVRLLNPDCKIWLIAHGIEVWQPLKFWKKAIWKHCDKIICVSRFTQEKVKGLHCASPVKCSILNNIPDPFLAVPQHFRKPGYLQERYQVAADQKIVFSLTRISATEHFKGYDQVIAALGRIKNQGNISYMLAGPYDKAEKARIMQLVSRQGLAGNFILTGHIREEELADHFLLADLFVLPSKKEGFGIVFAEAMTFGLPVICGNADGSIDAVRNPKMGTAIDPDDPEALEQAIGQRLNQPLTTANRTEIQRQCLKYFNQQLYMQALEKLLENEKIA